MTLIKKYKKDNVVKWCFLDIPFYKIVYLNTKAKIYFLGIRLIKLKYPEKIVSAPQGYNTEKFSGQVQNIVQKDFLRFIVYKNYISEYHKGKVAIIGVMPPENTGIAQFNSYCFSGNDLFDIFSDIKSMDDLFFCYNFADLNMDKNNIYSLSIYNKLNLTEKYRTKIYVLGNSYHNIPYLQQAIKEKDKRNSWLYIHEVNLLSLIFTFLNLDMKKLKELVKKCYGEKYQLLEHIDTWDKFAKNAKQCGIYGARIIALLTGVNSFIVNNDVAVGILNTEFPDHSVKIKKCFHPIPDLRNVQKYEKLEKGNIYVGTFGIPGDSKETKTVIQAVNILNNKYNMNVKTVLAGYDTKPYYIYALNDELRQYVIYFDSPSDNELFSIMKSMDVCVQLRLYPHGESSGPVSQILGIGNKLVVSKNFIDSDLEKFCAVINDPVSPEDLAQRIIKMLKKKKVSTGKLIEQYSKEKFFEKIAELIDVK